MCQTLLGLCYQPHLVLAGCLNHLTTVAFHEAEINQSNCTVLGDDAHQAAIQKNPCFDGWRFFIFYGDGEKIITVGFGRDQT